MGPYDQIIAACLSWDDFHRRVSELPLGHDKGRAFERLTQLYLSTAPEYRSTLAQVWLGGEVPSDVRLLLRLPHTDEGIDLIARTRAGEYWAIQCKFRSYRDQALNWEELSTFTSLAFVACRNIALAVVVHTTAKPIGKRELMGNTTEIDLLDRLTSLDAEIWHLIHARLQGKSIELTPREPRPHQMKAIAAAVQHFGHGIAATRGRLIMPCGTGKSLTAFWIAEGLEAKTILVAVPSLALIRQSLVDWTREYLARGMVPEWLCVCSDDSVGALDKDEFVGEVYDLGLPAHTDVAEITAILSKPTIGCRRVIFCTYQSSDRLAAAAREAGTTFDIAILDEAHKTVGVQEKKFATLLFDENIGIRYRVFMTATERVLRGQNDDVLSMDDENIYGQRFFHLSFKAAIEDLTISDYKVLTIVVRDTQVRELVDQNRLLNLGSEELGDAEARAVAAGIAVKRAFKDHRISHAISFHRSIRAADRFREQQDALNSLRDIGPETINLHISSKKTAGQRADLLSCFVSHERALMTNARCLTEGVDVPAIDCVLFADPKQSVVDIVQAAGRALRQFSGKEYGYIILPLMVSDNVTLEDFAETTAFRQIARTITALSSQDERIAEEFRAIQFGRRPSGRIVEIEGDVPVGTRMNLADFTAAITTRIWQRVGTANWMAFGVAREFARSLRLNSRAEWDSFCNSGKRPPDVPRNPDVVYAHSGWSGVGDWLGTGTVATHLREYRRFEEARAFVHSLRMKSQTEWDAFASSEEFPTDLPKAPHMVYAGDGWSSWGDWLGSGRIASYKLEYRSFEEARAFARSLGVKSREEWLAFARSKERPNDIPVKPERTYAREGWAGVGDWLGTGTIAPNLREYRPFVEARAFARNLGLNSATEWRTYCKSNKRLADIPTNPNRQYLNEGWSSWADWLGTGTIATNQQKYRAFEEARAFVRTLDLKSANEWRSYTKSGHLPKDIPAGPNRTYAACGWSSWGDWLGTKTIAPNRREYRSFADARAYARTLSLKSQADWLAYTKLEQLPPDVPATPWRIYAKDGWSGWKDWLGLMH
jgi:superfamily II DNA or RNA helicase